MSIEMLRPPDGKQVFFGPYDDIHEPDSFLPIQKKSEFCAPCHNGKFWGIPAYSSFQEWLESPYPEMGIQCQACHMPPDGILTNFAPGKGGLERDPLTIPTHIHPGSRDPNILANSVTMKVSAEQSGDSLKVMVTIYNDKTGHHVPTDHTARNMILLVEVTDVNSTQLEFFGGETIPFWGGIGNKSEGNYSGLPGKGFAKILIDNLTGEFPSPQWKPNNIQSDNRIAAFVADTSYYYYKVPLNPTILKISAKLIYRRFFKHWMDEKEFNIPDITMENESLNLLTVPVASVFDNDKPGNAYLVSQNFPNPFNSSTNIRVKLTDAGIVKLVLYDISGNEVKTFANKYFESGNHEFKMNLSDLSSGIYFFRIYAGNSVDTKKILLVK